MKTGRMKEMNDLIVYYSLEGNTEYVAQKLKENLMPISVNWFR